KNVVQYDDVMNRHREFIYGDRHKIVMGDDVNEKVKDLVEAEIETLIDAYTDEKTEAVDAEGLAEAYHNLIPGDRITAADLEGQGADDIFDILADDADHEYQELEEQFSSE